MRSSRSDIYNPKEVAVVHVMAKAVRHMYLFGWDSITNKSYDHRREWIETQMFLQAKYFGIDLIAYAVMSNHFHLILCSRPDVVTTWDGTEVARRWLQLCPKRKDANGKAMEPSEQELDSIRNKPKELEKLRIRLSDISWWMRLLCQKIAQKANWEMDETGRFFNGRFKSVRLLDNDAIMAGMAYVDLNQLRAKVCSTIEASNNASISRRIKALNELSKAFSERENKHLRPIEIKDPVQLNVLDPAKKSMHRCSEQGILPMSVGDYINLVDMTARLHRGSRTEDPLGEDPFGDGVEELKPILQRLEMDLETWKLWTLEFSSLFSQAAGNAKTMEAARTLVSDRKYFCRAHRSKHA